MSPRKVKALEPIVAPKRVYVRRRYVIQKGKRAGIVVSETVVAVKKKTS